MGLRYVWMLISTCSVGGRGDGEFGAYEVVCYVWHMQEECDGVDDEGCLDALGEVWRVQKVGGDDASVPFTSC